MGQRGPAPQPTMVKIIRGNPGKRPLNASEPQPAAGRPEMPAKVAASPRAAEEWERMCPILERMKLLTEADGTVLANLCMDAALLDQAQEGLSKSGLLIETKRTGMIRLNPLLELVARTTERVNRTAREFGLTPSSRSGLKAGEATPAANDPWSKFG